MSIRSTFSKALTLGALIVGLATIAAVWNPIPVSAIKEVDRNVDFGVISLAVGQSARLNVVNTRAIEPEDATTGDGTVRKVTLAFDAYVPEVATEIEPTADGRSCVAKQRFLRRESCEVSLRPGEAASLDFTASEGTRIRAVVIDDPNLRSVEDPNIRGNRRGIEDPNIRTTLEVQEGGRTSFVLSPAAVLFGEVDS